MERKSGKLKVGGYLRQLMKKKAKKTDELIQKVGERARSSKKNWTKSPGAFKMGSSSLERSK